MPKHVEPGGGLRSCAEQPGRRKQAGKSQHVHRSEHGREQVSAGEHEQSARAQYGELSVKQDRCDQIVDCERRLVDRHEGPYLGQLSASKWKRGAENKQRKQNDDKGSPVVTALRRHGREEYRLLPEIVGH
jgi:hypothetical protein